MGNLQQNRPITKITMLWLLCSVSLTSLPHLFHLPITIIGIFIALFITASLIHLKKIKTPHKFIRYFLTILIVAYILFNYGTLIGQDAGVALLISMSAIKLLEIFSQRDVYISVLIGFFTLVTHFLYSFSFGIVLYVFFCAVILLSTLLELSKSSDSNQLHIGTNAKFSSIVFMQSIPIMLVLFFFFPRIDSPLWSFKSNTQSGTTGLSEDMEMGMINSLSHSNAVAFRVEFLNNTPDNHLLYWRGPVLTHTDGRRWNKNANDHEPDIYIRRIPFSQTHDVISYKVTLEPSENAWYFALDLPMTTPKNTLLTAGYQIISQKPINQPVRYQVTSSLNYRLKQAYRNELVDALQLPENINSRTLELGQRFKENFSTPSDIISAALRYFVDNNFTYTLNPPLLTSNDPVDQFLFDTQRGFCEHFSAAFTILMRSAGVPARVVTGYQGGEYNPLGQHLTVRQRDAHAWSEVWIESLGWVRVDPTSVIAPNRIESGANEILAQAESSSAFLFNNKFILNIQHSIDWMDNQWTQWVVNYDKKKQRSFMSDLGLHGWTQIILTMTAILASICSLFAIYIIYHHQSRLTPQMTLWHKFCGKLEAIGLPKLPHEGPRDYQQRVIAQRPDLQKTIEPIFKDFIELLYAKQTNKALEVSLKHAIQQFKPKALGNKKTFFSLFSNKPVT